MRIFVLEDDFSQQTRIETTIEKLLKEHHITPSSFDRVCICHENSSFNLGASLVSSNCVLILSVYHFYLLFYHQIFNCH